MYGHTYVETFSQVGSCISTTRTITCRKVTVIDMYHSAYMYFIFKNLVVYCEAVSFDFVNLQNWLVIFLCF